MKEQKNYVKIILKKSSSSGKYGYDIEVNSDGSLKQEDLNKIEDCHNLNFKYCDGECKQVFDDEVFVVIFTGWEDKKCGFRVLKVAK